MNRLNNVTISEVKELKIDRPSMIPDEELALRNKKMVVEKKKKWNGNPRQRYEPLKL
jgi:predicted nuclease of restriction endonuclease-like RecB superfamily